jgi:hypothetical protein
MQLQPPTNRQNDPLGPARGPSRIGRKPSPWKRYWIAHRTHGLLAVAALCLLVFAAFVVWAVQESVKFYSRRPVAVPAAPANEQVIRLAESSRSVPGHVRLTFEVGPLEEGERVIVIRDLNSILESRLKAAGVEVTERSDNILMVYYKEELGQPVDVVSSVRPSAQQPAEIRATRIVIRLVLDRPRLPLRTLGQNVASIREERITISEVPSRDVLRRQRHSLYSQVYQSTLAYLRRIDLVTAIDGRRSNDSPL